MFSERELLYEEGVPVPSDLSGGMTATPMPVPELAGHAHADGVPVGLP